MRLPFFGSKKETVPAKPTPIGSPLFATPDLATIDPFAITPLTPSGAAPAAPATSPFDAEPLAPLDLWAAATEVAGSVIPAGSVESRTAASLAEAEAVAAADAARAAIWLSAGFAAAALVIGSLRLRH